MQEARAQRDRVLAELQQAHRSIEAAREERDRFLSSVSHELRTPLSAILLWTSLIEEEKFEDPRQLRDAIEAIKRSAEEQQSLIQNLVNTGRIVAGSLRLDRQYVEIAPFIRTVVENASPAALQKQIELAGSAEPDAGAAPLDRDRLQQAIAHLLSNAVKFTPPGGRVNVVARRIGAELEIAVSDTGAGIAAGKLPLLFAEVLRSPKTAPRTECGLGFGLLVARRIVELHGGTLSATSPGEGQGATFIVRLPTDANRILDPAATTDSANATLVLATRHIQLIVDEVDTRRNLAAALEQAGASVSAADSVPAAMESCERRRPDALVCDLILPTIDAREFLRDLRDTAAETGGVRLPAFALAHDRSPADLARAMEKGFQDCLPARVDPRRLIAILVEHLGAPSP